MFGASRHERFGSLAGVALLHVALGWLLLSIAPSLVRERDERIETFNVSPTPVPPPIVRPEPPAPSERETSAPSARASAARAAPSAPPPAPPRDIPPPVAAGIVPAGGGDTAGLVGRPQWMIEGRGSGSGAGTGQSSGAGGTGTGAGTGGAVTVRARLRGGRITPRDYPRAAAGHQGSVTAQLAVSETGAVTRCVVLRSSGNEVLDATTCRLIRERFRFTPARDAQGRAVADVQGWEQRWWRD